MRRTSSFLSLPVLFFASCCVLREAASCRSIVTFVREVLDFLVKTALFSVMCLWSGRHHFVMRLPMETHVGHHYTIQQVTLFDLWSYLNLCLEMPSLSPFASTQENIDHDCPNNVQHGFAYSFPIPQLATQPEPTSPQPHLLTSHRTEVRDSQTTSYDSSLGQVHDRSDTRACVDPNLNELETREPRHSVIEWATGQRELVSNRSNRYVSLPTSLSIRAPCWKDSVCPNPPLFVSEPSSRALSTTKFINYTNYHNFNRPYTSEVSTSTDSFPVTHICSELVATSKRWKPGLKPGLPSRLLNLFWTHDAKARLRC